MRKPFNTTRLELLNETPTDSEEHAMTTYFSALGLDDTATIADVKRAYAALASNGQHPDHGGDTERWKLVTAAFGEIKRMFAKKRGRSFGSGSDLAWLRSWNDLGKPAASEPPKQDAPKTERGDRCDHQHRDGEFCGRRAGHSGAHIKESSYAAHKTYSKDYSRSRYQSDPDYAERLKKASRESHAKARAAKKAAAAE